MFKILSIKLICALTLSDLTLKIDDMISNGYQPYQEIFEKFGDENTQDDLYSVYYGRYSCIKMVKYEQ